MTLHIKLQILYVALFSLATFITFNEWVPTLQYFIPILIIILYIALLIDTIIIVRKSKRAITKLTYIFLTILLAFPCAVSATPDTKEYLTHIDDFYFYKKEAFPDPGYDLSIYKRDQLLPTISQYRTKKTVNIGDTICFYKKNNSIYIVKTFLHKNYTYILDDHEIKPIINKQ